MSYEMKAGKEHVDVLKKCHNSQPITKILG